MGFANLAEYANADEAGRSWVTQFRKAVNTTATVTGSFIDYTYVPGSPTVNFYASAPLEAAFVDESKGFKVPSVSPSQQYLKNITVMTSASSATSTTNGRQDLILCDYLLYYPFIDTDTVDLQEMIQAVSIPRYSSGQVIAIAQAASPSIGQFTFTYTNQDGVSGRVSPNIFTQIVVGGGQSLTAHISGGGFHPYLPLQAGDSGVKSIESVTFTALGGGLMALIIVQPLLTFRVSQECRRTTTGNLESYGSAVSVDSIVHQMNLPEIKDGAVLGLLGKGNLGTLASSTLVGYIETVWD